MANKADRVPNPKDFAKKGEDSPLSAEAAEREANLDKLAESAAKKNKQKAVAVDRKNNALKEAYANNWQITGDAHAEVKLAQALVRKAKSHLATTYSVAKGDGCNVKLMKKLRALQDEDLDVIDQEMRDVAWLADLVQSPVAKVVTFESLLQESDKANPYTDGYTAGRLGEDFNPPHTPGSEPFVRYEAGWRDGQDKVARETFGKRASIRKPKPTAAERRAGAPVTP